MLVEACLLGLSGSDLGLVTARNIEPSGNLAGNPAVCIV